MHILGISCYYHDAAAALLHDGNIIAAAEEERFSRIKHDSGYPRLAIDFCLKTAGISGADLDYVVFYEKPLVKFERILTSTLGSFPKSWRTFNEAMITWLNDKLWIRSQLAQQIGIPSEKVLFVEHHLSHAASAFFASPFEDAAIVTIDGVGEWTTTTIGAGKASWQNGAQNQINIAFEQRFPHSIGLLYSAFTAYLGFHVNEGEYKVMGMSPYGEPRFMDKVERLFKMNQDGSFWLDMDYFSFHHSMEHTFNQKFVDLFGPPRVHESHFFTTKTNPDANPNDPKTKENQHYADIAASIQRATEEAMLTLIRKAHEHTGSENLCMAGGVALNSKANGRILRETPFKRLFIQPAAGDSGGALGAALYAYHVLLAHPRSFVQEHSYFGQEYSNAEIKAYLDGAGIAYQELSDEQITARVVDDLLQQKVIGWFQDRFEWGPRALGNRSILADPRAEEMKEIVNTKIKFREPFRPFAPVIMDEHTHTYFDMPADGLDYPARFMLVVQPIHPEPGENIKAVNHLGTGRLQTVKRQENRRYYDLIQAFGQATGVPVLLNTSFNLRGEPIVTTPANAMNTFMKSELDTLVLQNFVIKK